MKKEIKLYDIWTYPYKPCDLDFESPKLYKKGIEMSEVKNIIDMFCCNIDYLETKVVKHGEGCMSKGIKITL